MRLPPDGRERLAGIVGGPILGDRPGPLECIGGIEPRTEEQPDTVLLEHPSTERPVMEPLPDLAALSDEELKSLIDDLQQEEQEVSYRRRLLHGKIDILRAELVSRLQKQEGAGEGPLSDVDVDTLAAILAGKAAPPEA